MKQALLDECAKNAFLQQDLRKDFSLGSK